MGSSVIENNGTTNSHENRCVPYLRPKRPDFFPCTECGRFFTSLAMEVHKRTCLENESCKCSVCKSDSRKAKLEVFHNGSGVYSQSNPFGWRFAKTKGNMKPRFRDVLTGKVHNVNKNVNESKLLKFKFVEENSSIIQNMLKENKLTDCVNASFIEGNERIALNDHEYVSTRVESTENSDTFTENSNDVDKPSPTVKSKQKVNDHDCDRKLFCRYCKVHVFWESFGIHIIQHCEMLEEKFLKCPECERTFSQPALYLTHYLIHNSEHSLFCSFCRCSYPSCIYTERATESNFAENYPHHCYICLSHFSHPQTVINHMRLHSKEMPFKCTVCNRTFRQIGNLQRHMTTHRGDRPYKCPNCPSSFADPATLRNHERVHTGETPYICPYCTRGFSQIGNLKRHMALHLQKDPSSTTFSSTIEVSSVENTISIIKPPDDIKINANIPTECLESNNRSDHNTSDHIVKNITEISCDTNIANGTNRKNGRKNGKLKVFTCKICKKVYTWQHDLAVHFRTHTGEKPYKCEICGKQFAQSGAVRIHKERHHSGLGITKQKNMS